MTQAMAKMFHKLTLTPFSIFFLKYIHLTSSKVFRLCIFMSFTFTGSVVTPANERAFLFPHRQMLCFLSDTLDADTLTEYFQIHSPIWATTEGRITMNTAGTHDTSGSSRTHIHISWCMLLAFYSFITSLFL